MNLRLNDLPLQRFEGVVLLFLLLNSTIVFAQFSVGVAPPRIDFYLDAGASVVETITVFSEEDFEQRIVPNVEEWLLSLDGEFVLIPKDQEQTNDQQKIEQYSASEWIDFIDDPFLLNNITDLTLSFGLRVPETTATGSYWGAITLTTEPKENTINGTQMLSVAKLVVSIYVHVGQPIASGELIDLYIEEEDGNKQVIALVENTGNSILRFASTLNIIDTTGETSSSIELEERVILRDGVAKIKHVLTDELSDDSLLLTLLMEEASETLKLFGEIPLR